MERAGIATVYWEDTYSSFGFDSATWNDPSADGDGDQLSDIDEYLNDGNPGETDTDGDLMPDGWEVDNDLDPAVDDASGDKDGDGLTNLYEYQIGTGANDGDSDGDGLADGWEDQYFDPGDPTKLDPASDDSDSNGTSDADEDDDGVRRGIDCHGNDVGAGPAAVVRHGESDGPDN